MRGWNGSNMIFCVETEADVLLMIHMPETKKVLLPASLGNGMEVLRVAIRSGWYFSCHVWPEVCLEMCAIQINKTLINKFVNVRRDGVRALLIPNYVDRMLTITDWIRQYFSLLGILISTLWLGEVFARNCGTGKLYVPFTSCGNHIAFRSSILCHHTSC